MVSTLEAYAVKTWFQRLLFTFTTCTATRGAADGHAQEGRGAGVQVGEYHGGGPGAR
jgi:hypothetical protein